jgi:phospholipase/carboxylesterase
MRLSPFPWRAILVTSILGAWSGSAAAQAESVVRLRSRPHSPLEAAPSGLSRIAIAGGRETWLYVPAGIRPSHPAPLLVLLHGATQSADLWTRSKDLLRLADELGLVLLMPNSIDNSWDLMRGGYGPDVIRLDASLAAVFGRCTIDRQRIALGGFSDGATYALSLGVGNGDLFSALIAFSPGYLEPDGIVGKPGIYLAHGTADRILPIDRTSRRIVPLLRRQGYRLIYREFEGGHTIRPEDLRAALAWFAGLARP